jgi:histone H3/H4
MDIKFDAYIKIVLKQVHPDSSITKDGINEVNRLLHNLAERLIKDVDNQLHDPTINQIITDSLIRNSVRNIMGKELAKHAVSEGAKAVTKLNAYKINNQDPVAVLTFSISTSQTLINNYSGNVTDDSAATYMTAVLEYITAEILELSGRVAKNKKCVRIKPQFIAIAISNDDELYELFKHV